MRNAKYNQTATVDYLQYSQIFSLDNLLLGYLSAKKGKSKRRKVTIFSLNLIPELMSLYSELNSFNYEPKPINTFTIFCKSGQKQRTITNPHFRDLIVQHTLYNSIYQAFDKTFIHDSYGCRIGKGTHKASKQCQRFMRFCNKDSYFLQLDISKYYYSINHDILKESLKRVIKDENVLNIAISFLDTKEGIGLNVGAMISQLYGLIYLNRLDHYIKRVLKVKYYIRYVDDMVIIGETKEQCLYLKQRIEEYIHKYLKLKFSKWQIKKISQGINFVGYRTWQNKKLVRKRSLKTFSKALKQGNKRAIISLIGHAKDTNTLNYFLNKYLTS